MHDSILDFWSTQTKIIYLFVDKSKREMRDWLGMIYHLMLRDSFCFMAVTETIDKKPTSDCSQKLTQVLQHKRVIWEARYMSNLLDRFCQSLCLQEERCILCEKDNADVF